MPVWVFARLTLHEAVRNRLLQLALGLTLLFLALVAWGTHVMIDNVTSRTVVMLNASIIEILAFYMGSFLLTLLSVFVAGNSLRHEGESGLLHAIVSKPVRRFDLLAGKWLGAAIFLAVYTAFFTVGLIVVVGVQTGYVPPEPAPAAALILLGGLIVLSLRMLFGTFLGSMTSGIVPLMLYGFAWMGGMVELFGRIFAVEGMVKVGIVTSLLLPTDALWRAASYYLQTVAMLATTGSAGGGIPFVSPFPPTAPMVIWSALHALGIFLLGTWIFSRRDI
jgi:ABC-type transport system involved in multi-copper enzyme maturation permease subunit